MGDLEIAGVTVSDVVFGVLIDNPAEADVDAVVADSLILDGEAGLDVDGVPHLTVRNVTARYRLDSPTRRAGIFVTDGELSVHDSTVAGYGGGIRYVVTNLTAPSTAVVGESLSVAAEVENVGGTLGTVAVEYRIDGTVLGSETVTLGPGERRLVRFSVGGPGTTSLPIGTTTHGVYAGTASATAALTVFENGSVPGWPVVVAPDPARDLDGDGLFEDVTGDGTFNVIDVAVFLGAFDRSPVQSNAALFDFSGDGLVNIIDVSVLLGLT